MVSASPAVDSITIHSSWRGIVSSFVGSGAILAAGVTSVVLTSAALGSVILLVVGVIMLAIALFDYPIASVFDVTGVTRRPVLRRHRFAWTDIDQLTRVRPGIAAAARSLKPGGLALKVGRRRYLLVDQCESRDEFEQLVALLEPAGLEIGVDELIIPPAEIEPTFIYRRRRWSAQSTVD